MNKKLLLYVLQVSLEDFWYKEAIQGFLVGEQEAFLTVNPEQVCIPVPETFSRLANLISFDKVDIKFFQEFFGCNGLFSYSSTTGNYFSLLNVLR